MKLPAVLHDMKSFTSKAIIEAINKPGESRRDWLLACFRQFAKKTKQNKEYMVWTKINYPIELSYSSIYDQKTNYVMMNPVASGLVTDETAWKYSSAGEFSPLKLTENGEIEMTKNHA